MRTLVNAFRQVVDCRQLVLTGKFFSLPQETADDMARLFYRRINDFFGQECILDWNLHQRPFKDFEDALSSRKLKNGHYWLDFQGNVICDKVYNKTTLRKYHRQLIYPPIPYISIGSRESVDFSDYYEISVLSKRSDDAEFKKAILDLFDLEGKYYLAECILSDVYGWFDSTPMENGLFYGEANILIPYYCIEGELDQWAARLDGFAREIMSGFANTNICVEVNPRWGRYSLYFGQYYPALLNSILRSYARHFYFPEAGWAHYVCEATSSLGIGKGGDRLTVEKLENGGTLIRPKAPISELTIRDLKEVKGCVYKTIMPRENRIKNITVAQRLRCLWENIPVFENEIETDYGEVLFKHHGSIDIDMLRDALKLP